MLKFPRIDASPITAAVPISATTSHLPTATRRLDPTMKITNALKYSPIRPIRASASDPPPKIWLTTTPAGSKNIGKSRGLTVTFTCFFNTNPTVQSTSITEAKVNIRKCLLMKNASEVRGRKNNGIATTAATVNTSSVRSTRLIRDWRVN